jgi:hypothetical protein
MQPWADAQRKTNAEKWVNHNAACLLSGVPGMMYVSGGPYQFIQTANTLVVQTEEAHAYRIIPLDVRPHMGANVQLWRGDSRGRWEGDMLVIDTGNQTGKSYLDQRGRFFTEEARVVERLRLVDANTLHYQATVEDPNVFTRPWTIAFAFRRNEEPGLELWEEACHEANQSLRHILAAGLGIYPGISARQAQELKAAWEAAGR